MSVLTATVTLGSGTMTVTPTGGVATEVPSSGVSNLQVFKSVLQPAINLPTAIENTVFPPGVPFEQMNPDPTQWYVRIVLINDTYVDLPMGRITSHPAWLNTQAGAEIARAAIATALAA